MKIIFPLKCWGPASLSSSDHVPWTCLLHWNNHLHFTALKVVFWLGVFLSNGIGNFMKLCARRRLCNRKIISLLVAVQASTNEPSFPFGLCSDWSLRPCSPSVPEFSDFMLLLYRVSSLLPTGAALQRQGGCLLQPVTHWWSRGKALLYPWSWRFQLIFSLRYLQVWLDLARLDRCWPGAEWIHRPCFLVAFVQRLIPLNSKGNKA